MSELSKTLRANIDAITAEMEARFDEVRKEPRMRTLIARKAALHKQLSRETFRQLDVMTRDRVRRGRCSHCDGPVPCQSPFGDKRPGVRHG